jgi:signal transduction histidine kinase
MYVQWSFTRMPESQEQPEDRKVFNKGSEPSLLNKHSEGFSSSLHLEHAAMEEQPLLNGREHDLSLSPPSPTRGNFPGWLRPFFSLRVQLTLVYAMILALVVVTLGLLIYQRTTPPHIIILAMVITVVGGSLIAFVFTSLLLRPLSRVTDAAQAIAVGDLQQRKRLPLRLPPQDEADRLAGSLNEMVTRLERAEGMKSAAEQRFQRFFADASHQLRTPLTSIRGFTEVLIRGAKDDPETAQRILWRMKGEVERMTRLINDLLILARLDDGRPLKMQYLNLMDLANDGIAQARSRVTDDRKISLLADETEIIGLQGDKDRIKQLFFILLDNAIRYGPPAPEGTITLCVEKEGDRAVIRVLDNGGCISKKDLQHIFEAFYKGHHQNYSLTSSGTNAGAGLGLTIASAIVRAHHGSITASSDPEIGTEFRVTLPCTN